MAVGSIGSARVPGNDAVFAREISQKHEPESLWKRHRRAGLWNYLPGGVPGAGILSTVDYDAPDARLPNGRRHHGLRHRGQRHSLPLILLCTLLGIYMGVTGCNRHARSSAEELYRQTRANF